MYFNPRSPCGERPTKLWHVVAAGTFQSTLPVWGATWWKLRNSAEELISIHAPRVGSDPRYFVRGDGGVNISIHAPRVGSDAIPGGL